MGKKTRRSINPTGTTDTVLHGDMGVPSPVKPLHTQMV